MSKVLIVVDSAVEATTTSLTTMATVSAIKSAITADINLTTTVEIITADYLEKDSWLQFGQPDELIFCPLTLNLPDNLPFSSTGIISACLDVLGLREQLAQKLDIPVGDGCFWLPVVLTAKGPLYGEAIGLTTTIVGDKLPEDLSLSDISYYQPYNLSDVVRQPLYHMAHQLLQLLSAPPATYLVQFGLGNKEIWFDRVLPFPAAPALASVGVQKPDLFFCHWCCLRGLPVRDLQIIPSPTSIEIGHLRG
ncbi:MAG: hypothetical protein VKL59_00250 [Nostocaceae cyanobacterium]|nr:hypothetical protein [Nostocaceae cyanobacterium]